MESLLLSGNIVTLEGIKKLLYSFKEMKTIGGIRIIPNGTNSEDLRNYDICDALQLGLYRDAVLFMIGKNEYPLYFGTSSRQSAPNSIAYGKKDGLKLILCKDNFRFGGKGIDNTELESSTFIEAKISGKNRKAFSKSKRIEIYNFLDDKRKKVDLNVIGKANLDAIEESADQIGKAFALLKTR